METRDERRRPSGRRAPVIDDDVTGRELDREVRQDLATLAAPVAGTVARHLVMAGRLLDSDPELAFAHTQEARRLAGRVAVVREAAGFAAYEAGHYDVALSELRAARRMSGRADYLPVMADCERGVGRPERALQLADDPGVRFLDAEGRAELALVLSGALRDLGRADEAERTLRAALPARGTQAQWVARLQYALGDLLAEAGRTDEAVAAFSAAEAGDVEGSMDAGERLVVLLG
jgi:tetratricopeptide (TPR) repeat protein